MNSARHDVLGGATVLLAAILGACSTGAPTDDTALVLVTEAVEPGASPPQVQVEVAAKRDERALGLSNRLDVPAATGMLFVYREPSSREFWMKDCLVGLDVAFLDGEGRVLSLATLPPGAGLPHDSIPRVAEPRPVSFVLETGAGELGRLGVEEGERVDVSRVVVGVEPD